MLKEQLGARLAEDAGVDFESPVREPIAPFGSPKDLGRREHDARPRERPGPERRGERGHHGDRPRPSTAPHRARDERRTAPKGASLGGERRPTVWRDEDARGRKGARVPRRGADPKAERAAAAGRPRERIGAIERDGRSVVVERLVGAPPADAEPGPRKPPGRAGAQRPAPAGDDRLRRPRGPGPRDSRPPDREARPDRTGDRRERPAAGERRPGENQAASRADRGAAAARRIGPAARMRAASGPRGGRGPIASTPTGGRPDSRTGRPAGKPGRAWGDAPGQGPGKRFGKEPGKGPGKRPGQGPGKGSGRGPGKGAGPRGGGGRPGPPRGRRP